MIFHNFQMRKLRGREVNHLTQGDTTSYWWRRNSNQGVLASDWHLQWFSDLSKNEQLILDEQDLNQGLTALSLLYLSKKSLYPGFLYFRGLPSGPPLTKPPSMHLDSTPLSEPYYQQLALRTAISRTSMPVPAFTSWVSTNYLLHY